MSLLREKSLFQGKCAQMCPETEIKMREKEHLLHPLEILAGTQDHKHPKADRNKIVKEYCRSAAGQHMQRATILRPYSVLQDTVSYLLDDVISNENFTFRAKYDFIHDRLRAVRQDMIIQDLPKPQSICLLQPIVRFYAFSAYRLCTEPVSNFDPQLNAKHLQECVKRLLVMYDDCELIAERCRVNNLSTIGYSSIYEEERGRIEAIYLLFNLGDGEAIRRCLALPHRWKKHAEVQQALEISLAVRRNNFVRVARLIQSLSELLSAVACLKLAEIRLRGLEIMSVAFSNKIVKFPMGKLQELLVYSNVDDLINDLQCCNISFEVKTACVHFLKCDFNTGGKGKIPLRHETFVQDKLEKSTVREIVLYDMQVI